MFSALRPNCGATVIRRMPDNLHILSLAASGDPVAERLAVSILLQANRKFFRDGCTLSLQRCCGLPEARGKLLRPSRDFWLRVAYTHCQGKNTYRRGIVWKEEINRFKSIFWPKWKTLQAPPEGTSELRQALFKAAKIAAKMRPDDPMGALPETPENMEIILKNSPPEISKDHRHDEGSLIQLEGQS